MTDAASGIGGASANGIRTGRRISVRGVVQGVGFRPWVQRFAREQGIGGRVLNDGLGVTIEAFGPEARLEAFLKGLSDVPPPAARVREIRWQPIAGEDNHEFVIDPSRSTGVRRPSIPPDLATCPECLREILDVGDRRHGYAFTNCTQCGPRYTITRDTPYDRSTTTMAGFPMCARCQREYQDAADRRFHAQANACPECGPRLRLLGPKGEELPGDALQRAAARLRRGEIVAVKGLGGFHLACDATSADAVRRLRERKHRDEKPFAVMVTDLDAAERLAQLAPGESRLLASVERPIVLVRRREGCGLAAELAPGNPLVGLMLAYTPLHHLLLAAAGRPLVMTSGNLSGEPIVHRDAQALERLAGVADAFLVHDREIQNRCEDSVTRVVAGRPLVLRRARGYVPRGVPVPRGFARPVLACGAQLNNTFCLAAGQTAYLGPHVGDLEGLESCRSLEEAVERLERFVGIRPSLIAHDLHPDYHSTSYALARPEPIKIGVQHHHAHVASAMAEHGLAGPVLGVAYDGTGYGGDGTSWGGELLLARYESFERLATFRPIRLAGGDRAIREVWRIALALLDDAFEGAPPLDAIPLFRRVAARDIAVVRRMIARGANAPRAHGVGRYFDALGAIGLGRSRASYEGQVALEWNLAADVDERGQYPVAVETGSPMQLDLRPLVRAAVEDLRSSVSAAVVSARFHNSLAAATADLVRLAALRAGHLPVVLSGGCFQNALLAERVLERLRPDFDVRLHGEVPPGDGGIALGQALVADAKLRQSSCA